MMAKRPAVLVNTEWRHDEPSRITLRDYSLTMEQEIAGWFLDGTPYMGPRSWAGSFVIPDVGTYQEYLATVNRPNPARWFLVADGRVGEILPTVVDIERVEFVGMGSFA